MIKRSLHRGESVSGGIVADLVKAGGVGDDTKTVRSHVWVLPEHGTTVPTVLHGSVEAATEDRRAHESIVGIALDGRLSNNKLVKGHAGVLVDLEETRKREVVAGVPNEFIARTVILLVVELLRVAEQDEKSKESKKKEDEAVREE